MRATIKKIDGKHHLLLPNKLAENLKKNVEVKIEEIEDGFKVSFVTNDYDWQSLNEKSFDFWNNEEDEIWNTL